MKENMYCFDDETSLQVIIIISANLYSALQKTNPQRRFTIKIHADVITVIINCFHSAMVYNNTNVPLVDDEV